jgi:hypothetical protein
MADSAGSLVAAATPNSKGVLAGRSAGRLTLNSGITEGDVRLQPQPQGILTKSLLSGVGMLGLDLGPLENIPETWDCFATITNTTKLDGSASTAEMVSGIGGISQCLVTHAKVKGGDDIRMAALHRLGVAVDLLTELPAQLGDFIAVGLQQAAGDSVLDFRLRTAVPTPTETPTSQPPAPGSTSAPGPMTVSRATTTRPITTAARAWPSTGSPTPVRSRSAVAAPRRLR